MIATTASSADVSANSLAAKRSDLARRVSKSAKIDDVIIEQHQDLDAVSQRSVPTVSPCAAVQTCRAITPTASALHVSWTNGPGAADPDHALPIDGPNAARSWCTLSAHRRGTPSSHAARSTEAASSAIESAAMRRASRSWIAPLGSLTWSSAAPVAVAVTRCVWRSISTVTSTPPGWAPRRMTDCRASWRIACRSSGFGCGMIRSMTSRTSAIATPIDEMTSASAEISWARPRRAAGEGHQGAGPAAFAEQQALVGIEPIGPDQGLDDGRNLVGGGIENGPGGLVDRRPRGRRCQRGEGAAGRLGIAVGMDTRRRIAKRVRRAGHRQRIPCAIGAPDHDMIVAVAGLWLERLDLRVLDHIGHGEGGVGEPRDMGAARADVDQSGPGGRE